MLALSKEAEVLGLSTKQAPESPIESLTRIDDGLPINTVKHLSKRIAPDDMQFKYRLLPRSTYERRKARRMRLSPEEGTRLVRLARVWNLALDVWRDEKAARGFLFRPHMMLEDKCPVDIILQSEFGAEMVLGILNGLKYGSAA